MYQKKYVYKHTQKWTERMSKRESQSTYSCWHCHTFIYMHRRGQSTAMPWKTGKWTCWLSMRSTMCLLSLSLYRSIHIYIYAYIRRGRWRERGRKKMRGSRRARGRSEHNVSRCSARCFLACIPWIHMFPGMRSCIIRKWRFYVGYRMTRTWSKCVPCMYVFIMYVYKYMYIYIHVNMYIYMYICTHIHTHTYTYTHVYVYICIIAHTPTHTRTHMFYICTHKDTHAYTHASLCWIYMYTDAQSTHIDLFDVCVHYCFLLVYIKTSTCNMQNALVFMYIHTHTHTYTHKRTQTQRHKYTPEFRAHSVDAYVCIPVYLFTHILPCTHM